MNLIIQPVYPNLIGKHIRLKSVKDKFKKNNEVQNLRYF